MSPSNALSFTLFPPLPLRQDRDGNVESLDHYMVRLADGLGISLLSMGRMLASNLEGEKKSLQIPGSRSAWIGPDARTADHVTLLSIATGVPDLYRGTFRNLSPILSNGGFANCSVSASARKWCPGCYSEWDEGTSFEPLYWAFGPLSQCPIHECRLLTRCLNCGSKQSHGAKYAKRRLCKSCLDPLSFRSPRYQANPFESWINQQCIQTARSASMLRQPLFPDSFDRYFRRVLTRWLEGEPTPRYVRASIRHLWARWDRGERFLRPTMTQYLNFASYHGTSVEEIMLSPESAAAEPLLEGASESFIQFSICRPLNGALESLELALEKLIDSEIPLLPSVPVISGAFDIHMRYVRERMRQALLGYNAVRERQGRRCARHALGRAFCCAVSLIRAENGSKVNEDELAMYVLMRARCSEEIARCAASAGLVVFPCFIGEKSGEQARE